MSLQAYSAILLPAIEEELRRALDFTNDHDRLGELQAMLAYHMGWQGEGAGPNASGKRIRPLLLLLVTIAAGGEWPRALPAAAAVELIHNFSLIHDDIEDNSPLRRGRPTVWKKWGIAQALNAGDLMFALAHLELLRLQETSCASIALQAARILQETCVKLTQGQFLDISYENRQDLTLEDYWPMISGKTAALLAACTELGALLAEADETQRLNFREFGRNLGLAFQAQDDLLGIWGNAALTGKSAESDLLSGKKSLPVLFGLSQNGEFARRWRKGAIQPNEVASLARQLEIEGARAYTQEIADHLTQQALHYLEQAKPQSEAKEALIELSMLLVKRSG
jgi:geranylgeranyl diphosphate synthase type I